jgi:hypothetical protein
MHSANAQVTFTTLFDNGGAEAGITTDGASTFSFGSANWSGGDVHTAGITALYASGLFAYRVQSAAQVTFDRHIDSVTFFYVHQTADPAGVATAYDSLVGGNVIGTATSNVQSFGGDPANFMTIDPGAAIRRIEFSGGKIDNFAFTSLATPVTFSFKLDGPQSATASIALGSGECILNAAETSLAIDITHNVVSPTVSHIHSDTAGGAVVFGLSTGSSPISDTWATITPAEVALLLSGDYYINVHSTDFPPGEIRGQIVQATAPLDVDNDGLTDDDEVNIHGSNPFLRDSDGDGVEDAIEVALGTDPADSGDTPSVSAQSNLGLALMSGLIAVCGLIAIGSARRRHAVIR